MKKMSINPLIIGTLVIIVAVGAFFGGMKYQQSKMRSFAMGGFGGGQPGFVRGNGQGRTGGQMGQGGQGNMRFGQGQGYRPVAGEIINSDDKSFTVKLSDGSSKIILFSSTATIGKAVEATQADVKVGEMVAVFGIENADGSVTAQNIQLNPISRVGENSTPSATPKR